MADIGVELKRGRTSQRRKISNWSCVKREDIKSSFQIEAMNRYETLQDEMEENELDEKWKTLQ